ncbi:DNA polymerase III subunit beta [Pseudarthrobacter sp. Y6]|uniref:DNA polymerase III subunit beta n=1 Tax=Pseudarthrobacter sp. Y6 TaxID=3418422 RepID=UPI003CE7D8F5
MTTSTLDKTFIPTIAVATGTEWLAAIAAVSPAVPARPAVPVLSFVKVFTEGSTLYLQGFDWEVSATTQVAGDSAPVEPFLVPYKWLTTTLKSLLGKDKSPLVGLGVESGKVVLRCAGYEIPVDGAPVLEYPAVPATGRVFAEVDSATLKPAMARVASTASTDCTLPILTGLQVDANGSGLDICATDRYRLAYDHVSASVQHNRKFLIGAKTWAAVAKNLAGGGLMFTDIPANEYAIGIITGKTVYTVMEIRGDYPKIRSLIGAGHSTVVELDRAKLLAITTVAAKLTERNLPVRLTITSAGAMVVADPDAKSPLAAVNWVAGSHSDGWVVAFNPSYLLDAIKAFTTDMIRFSQQSLPKPAVFTEAGVDAEDNEAFRHMIMPVRLPA